MVHRLDTESRLQPLSNSLAVAVMLLAALLWRPGQFTRLPSIFPELFDFVG